jgi:alginate O-acetyltransferase complex protein AlgI
MEYRVLGNTGLKISRLGFGGIPIISSETLYYMESYFILFVLGFIGSTPLLKNLVIKLKEKVNINSVINILEPITLVVLLVLCTSYLIDGSFNPFLYFRF